jgi:hypothetical protein
MNCPLIISGVPEGIRTHVAGVKGLCPTYSLTAFHILIHIALEILSHNLAKKYVKLQNNLKHGAKILDMRMFL